jgi:hypothetical protein
MPSSTASVTCLLTACILTVLVHPAAAQMEDSQTADPPVSAEAAFAHYCAPCHGDDARGKGSKAFGLSNPPPDLTQLTIRNGRTFPRDRLERLIDGREDLTAHNMREMPIWGEWFKLEGEEAFDGVPEQETRIRKRIEELLDLLQSMQQPAK